MVGSISSAQPQPISNENGQSSLSVENAYGYFSLSEFSLLIQTLRRLFFITISAVIIPLR
jgi:hypothetical protein